MSDSTSSNILLNSKTENFPDGVMGSLRAELGLMAGFMGAFILAFALWCILFKHISDKGDRERAEIMARGVEMREGVRHREGNVGHTRTAAQSGQSGEIGVLGREQRVVEAVGAGSKED